jgi:hypothetical protein
MTALYLLADEYRAAAEKLSDLDLAPEVVFDTLESISGELETKAQQVGYMVRNVESTIEAIKAFTQAQADRAKSLQRRADGLRSYLQRCMEATAIEKIEGPGIVLSFRKSSSVVIDEPGLIPAEFMRIPPQPEAAPDKPAIAKAIKAGIEVAGAHIEHHLLLQIK